MHRRLPRFYWLLLAAGPGLFELAGLAQPRLRPGGFSRLEPLPAPRLVASAPALPGGACQARNLLDGQPLTEYVSNAQGTNTFVELDFGAPTLLLAFRHLERNASATVAASELTFFDAAGQVVTNLAVRHVNQPAGVTLVKFPARFTAQRLRWRVTALGSSQPSVGGAELSFFTLGASDVAPKSRELPAKPLPNGAAP